MVNILCRPFLSPPPALPTLVPTTALRDSSPQRTPESWSNSAEGFEIWSETAAAQSLQWEDESMVLITDMKPSRWYNVRHRYSWRGAVDPEDPEEVGHRSV